MYLFAALVNLIHHKCVGPCVVYGELLADFMISVWRAGWYSSVEPWRFLTLITSAANTRTCSWCDYHVKHLATMYQASLETDNSTRFQSVIPAIRYKNLLMPSFVRQARSWYVPNESEKEFVPAYTSKEGALGLRLVDIDAFTGNCNGSSWLFPRFFFLAHFPPKFQAPEYIILPPVWFFPKIFSSSPCMHPYHPYNYLPMHRSPLVIKTIGFL